MAYGRRGLSTLILASSSFFSSRPLTIFSLRRGLVSCLVFWYVRFAVVFIKILRDYLLLVFCYLYFFYYYYFALGGWVILGWGLTSSCMVTCWQPFFWVDSSSGFFRLLLRYRVRCFYEFPLPVLRFPCTLFQFKLSSSSPDGSALLFFSIRVFLGFSFLRTTCKFVVLPLMEGVNGGVSWKRFTACVER